MVKKKKKQLQYLVESEESSNDEINEKELNDIETLEYKIAVREHDKKFNVGSIEIKLSQGVNMEIKEFKDRFLKWFLFLVSFAFIQTIVLLGILYVLERRYIYAIVVVDFKSPLIYPYETGGFFFALILISDILVEFIRIKINNFLD